MFKSVEMIVFGNNVVGVCGNGTIHKLIIVLVDIGQQMKMIICFLIVGTWMSRYGFNHVLGYFRRSMNGKDFFIFHQYLVAHTQTIIPFKKVCPYFMVLTS